MGGYFKAGAFYTGFSIIQMHMVVALCFTVFGFKVSAMSAVATAAMLVYCLIILVAHVRATMVLLMVMNDKQQLARAMAGTQASAVWPEKPVFAVLRGAVFRLKLELRQVKNVLAFNFSWKNCLD